MKFDLRDLMGKVVIKPLEVILFVLFAAYLVFPINPPLELAPYIECGPVMALLFVVSLSLFFYTNPILGVISIFVIYEMIRRSSLVTGEVPLMPYIPSQRKHDVQMVESTPKFDGLLEEEVVAIMAPIGKSDPNKIIDSSYKPVQSKVIDGKTMYVNP